MKRFFAFFLILLLPFQALADLEASVSRTTVAEGENFQVYLRSDAPLSQNDYAPYTADFDIIGRQTSSHMQFINGQQTQNYETVLTLTPKRTGKLVLPSITALGVATSPVDITVLSADEALKAFGPAAPSQDRQKAPDGAPKAVIRAELSSLNVYEGLPVVYTINLFTTELFAEGSIIPPESDDYILKQLGDGVSEQKEINGVTGFSVTHKFSLTPKKAGKIRIPPARFAGTLPSTDQQNPFLSSDLFGLDLFRQAAGGMPSAMFGGQRITAASSALTLSVLPKPQNAGKFWFPATKADISDTLDPATGFTEGDAITRTVTVTAEGSDPSLIPDIVFPASPDFKQYPSKTENQKLFRDDKPVAVKKRRFVFIPTRSGPLILPEITLQWFDIKTKSYKTVELPKRRIIVAPAAGTAAKAPPVVEEKSEQTPPPEQKTVVVPDIPASKPVLPEIPAKSPLHMLLAGAFLGAAFILLGVFLLNTRSAMKKKAGPSPSPDGEKAADALQKACKNKDPVAAKDALLRWGAFLFADKPPLSLSDLAEKVGSVDFSKAVFALNASLYGGKRDDWDADALWRVFKKVKTPKKQKSAGKDETVAPLYPL